MRTLIGIVIFCAIALMVSGCGGGGGGGQTPVGPPAGTGSAAFTVQWPERTRLIPVASNSIKVEITRDGSAVTSTIVDRPQQGGQSSARFDSLPVGDLVATATAYPEAGAVGTAQARGSVAITIVAGQETTVTLTIQSTIDRIEISPANPTVEVGASTTLTATPRDAADSVVLVAAGDLQWVSLNTAAATVDGGGVVTGVAPGEAEVKVTETESGKTASVTVQVTGNSTVTGAVLDAANSPVAGVTVTSGAITATTGPDGVYSISLPVGTHDLAVSKSGYITVNRTGVAVAAGATSTQNFNLPLAASPYRIHGLCVGLYGPGQAPGSVLTEDEIRQRLCVIAPYTTWVRTYGCTHGLELAGRLAKEMGLHTAIGCYLGTDPAANDQEIANLISVANAGYADIVVVGNEFVSSKDPAMRDQYAGQLITYIEQVRAAVSRSMRVTTGELYTEYVSRPSLISAVDVVFGHFYGFWSAKPVEQSTCALDAWWGRLKAAAGAKEVWCAETGWPSAGGAQGAAVPSLQNAATYCLNVVSWARSKNVPLLYFAGWDEAWKTEGNGVGPNWGIWDQYGVMKPGFEAVFNGTDQPSGPCSPTIEFTSVPPYGSFQDLQGIVYHADPAEHRVAVYIKVGSGWWTKPRSDWPLTYITASGSWTCDITTGGVDQTATQIAAYLIRATYSPPLALGGASLPAELEQNAVAKVEATRSP